MLMKIIMLMNYLGDCNEICSITFIIMDYVDYIDYLLNETCRSESDAVHSYLHSCYGR